MPDNTNLNPQELFDTGVAGYLKELRLLALTLSSEDIALLLPLFRDYEDFLARGLARQFSLDLAQQLKDEDDTIFASRVPASGRSLFNCANLAAACEIFNGWTIEAGAITEANTAQFLMENMRLSGMDQEHLGKIMAIRLNRGDAVRTAQIIKLLGLLPAAASHYAQLALGASMARRDREGFHRIPGIGPSMPGGEFSSTSGLNFAVKGCEPDSLVIIDNDPKLEQDFLHINRSEGPKIQALNQDLYVGLEQLAATMTAGNCGPRNLVTLYRLEPRAIPDIPRFLDKLVEVTDDGAYFVATIGSGNSNSEFADRTAVLDEMTAALRSRDMSPLRIVMHGQELQPNGHASPDFGISEFASFEILFCRLGDGAGLQSEQHGVSATATKKVRDLNPELWNSFLPSNRMELARGVVTFLEQLGRLRGQSVNLLNLGSGVGVTSSCLEKAYPAFSLTDIDQVPYRNGLMHERYLQADVASLPLRNHSYDALFSSFTFSYLGNSEEVMKEWLRVLRPGGDAYFIFHAPHSAYLTTAKKMLSAGVSQDFFKLLPHFPGPSFTGLYDWYCRQSHAWKMAFTEEQEFLSYAHEIQVCRHLVDEVASLMFSSVEQIEGFFSELDVTDVSVHVLDEQFNVLQPGDRLNQTPFLAWFIVLTKPVR